MAHGWHVAGEPVAAKWAPATVPGGAGQKRFKPFQNSNGSKMFNFSKFSSIQI
jgi:hypothetical protein